MPTDATGTPTSLGIPKYNVDVDAPSGLGFNAAMDAIDLLLTKRTVGLTAAGDIVTASAADTPVRIAIGSNGQVLTVVSGAPAWAAAPVVSVPTYTWATLPIAGTHSTNGQPDAIIVDSSSGMASLPNIWICEYRIDLDATYRWRIVGGSTPHYLTRDPDASYNTTLYTIPAAGSWDYRALASISGFAGGISGTVWLRVNGSHTASVGYSTGSGAPVLYTVQETSTRAKNDTIAWDYSATGSGGLIVAEQIRPVKVAGNV